MGGISGISNFKSGWAKNSNTQRQVRPRPFCGRCLQHGHWRLQCRNSIKCKSCFSFGHIARTCPATARKAGSNPKIQPMERLVWKRKEVDISGWFKMKGPMFPRPEEMPSVYSSFTEYFQKREAEEAHKQQQGNQRESFVELPLPSLPHLRRQLLTLSPRTPLQIHPWRTRELIQLRSAAWLH